MSRQPAPKPMSRLRRGVVIVLAFLLVSGLGAVVMHQNSRGTADTTASQKPVNKHRASSDSSASNHGWEGLSHAGLPAPGSWSSKQPVVETALRSLNVLLDPSTPLDQWGAARNRMLVADGDGNEHPMSDAPRYLWLHRSFDAN